MYCSFSRVMHYMVCAVQVLRRVECARLPDGSHEESRVLYHREVVQRGPLRSAAGRAAHCEGLRAFSLRSPGAEQSAGIDDEHLLHVYCTVY